MKKKEILDQVEVLKHRIETLESDYSQVLVNCAKLESQFQILKQDKKYGLTDDGDIY
jgi:hypothetical protein